MNHPEIRIKSSFLLNGKIIPLLTPELESLGRQDEAGDEFISNKVKEYNLAWQPYETKILSAMTNILGLEFKQNIIDTYVTPFSNSFSDPMVISTKYTSSRVIDVLTHELTHRLLTDNTKLSLTTGRKLSSYWAELFGDDHSFKELVHIPVHAMLEYIFVDILLEPERLVRDKEFCQKYDDYDKAWKYVEANDYRVILKSLRELYQSF